MSVLCKPAVAVPEHTISQAETLQRCRELHADHPQLELALSLIENTGVEHRNIVRPVDEILAHPGFEERNRIYEQESKRRVPPVIRAALANAGVGVQDIDAIVYVSCTGFMMPSMTAWLINEMGFRLDTRQLPIAQLGCAAGGAAINWAQDLCRSRPPANVLIVACELCSLCYQPTDLGIGNLLSNGLFGDAIAATVVRGSGGTGMRLDHHGSYLMPDTESWIRFDVKATGFHFMLDKRVPGTMDGLAPGMRHLAADLGWNAAELDFYAIHAGGPRILDGVTAALGVDPAKLENSRATLTQHGNIASAVVLETMRRIFEQSTPTPGERGIIAGFGPGITAEVALGTWVSEAEQAPAELERCVATPMGAAA